MEEKNRPHSHVSLTVMRSKFDAYVYSPLNESSFRTDLKRVKEYYPKAKHYLYAYRIKESDGSIKEGMSENGEPVKAMHKVLLQLRSQEVLNVGIIIVRHFGGKELGASNLEHTFLDAFNAAYDKYQKGVLE